MRNKETGEFELVVGNGQLVSGFFIVVLLFAVGVAMGYILGRNSEKSAKGQETAEAAPCVAADSRPQPASQAPQQAAPPQPSAATEAQTPSVADTPQPTTQPARQQEPPPTKAAPSKQDLPKPEPPKAEAPKPAPPPANNAVAASSEAPPGFYWQVTARANQEAVRATLKILKDRGFPAYLTPGPNGMTRVIVGPYKDTTSKAKAKTELEGIGFPPVAHNRE